MPSPNAASVVQPPMPPGTQWNEDFFIYSQAFTSIAPAGTSNQSIQIQGDSHFKWIKGTFDCRDDASGTADVTDPNITIQITDSGSGRNLFLNPVRVGGTFGTGQLPFILPLPRIFKARSSINIVAVNNDAALTYTLNLYFIGVKMFNLGGAALPA